MAKPARIPVEAPVLDLATGQSASTDIVAVVTQNPGIVLLDREKFDAWYEKLSAKAPTEVDISTNKGRDALRSFAAEVRREKAAIDKARLGLTKGWRDMTDQANAAGKEIAQRLENLAVEKRKPLTDWEEAEDARMAHCREIIADFKHDGIITMDDTADSVRRRGTHVWNIEIDPEKFGDMLPEAQAAKDAAVATLKTGLARLTQEEADRAELARLRAEAEARDAREREEQEAREAEQRKAEEAHAAEEKRLFYERQEADRLQHMREEAARLAREEESRKAGEAQAERDRAHQEELAAERAKVAEAERLRLAEAARIAELDRQREEREAAERAAAQKLADEQAELEKNKAHRTRVKTAAKQAIMTCGASEETAQKIVLAIIAGEIPAVKLAFS